MKKIIGFLLVAALFSTNLFGQDSIKIPIPDSTKLTVGKVYTDVKAGIEGLAKGLKVGAEAVFAILVKQQIVYAITYCILLIAVIISWICYKKFWKYADENDWSEGHFIIVVVWTLINFAGTIAVICTIGDIVTGFINPQYGAIKDIFEFIKPKQ